MNAGEVPITQSAEEGVCDEEDADDIEGPGISAEDQIVDGLHDE